MQTADQILTVLVLYNSKLSDAPGYTSLSAALKEGGTKGHLFIYDNSPESQKITPTDAWTMHYVHDPANPGVGKAYNEGYAYALRHDLAWLLLADQDTTFPKDIFDQYSRARMAYPDCGLFAPTLIDDIGIVSPFRRGLMGGRRLKKVSAGKINLDEACAINSGLLLSVGLFGSVGGYDERIRLDFSDVNFFRKLKRHMAHCVALDVVCRHALSSSGDTKLKDALSRFIIYVEGSRIAGRAFGSCLLFECHAILRATRLSWKYRSLRFFGSLLSRAS